MRLSKEELILRKTNLLTWRPLPICTKFQISSWGTVRNVYPRKPKNAPPVLPRPVPFTYRRGYRFCCIWLPSTKKNYTFSVARMLGLVFLSNPRNCRTIDHINRKITHNYISNLRWATQIEQCENRTKISAYKRKQMNKKISQTYARRHTSTEGLNVKIGGVYEFTNDRGYSTRITPTRVTEKSVFVRWVTEDGNVWGGEMREGVTEFMKYTLISI